MHVWMRTNKCARACTHTDGEIPACFVLSSCPSYCTSLHAPSVFLLPYTAKCPAVLSHDTHTHKHVHGFTHTPVHTALSACQTMSCLERDAQYGPRICCVFKTDCMFPCVCVSMCVRACARACVC